MTRTSLAIVATLFAVQCFGQTPYPTRAKPGEDMPKFEAPTKTWDGPVQFLSGKAPAPPMGHVSKGIMETVTVKFPIQTDGTVGQIEVVASTNKLLSELVISAVKEWRFKPATKAGVAQVLWAQQSFTMEL